ncbi:unnamed protein product [Medioppia subpectinata]|uniref:F-box domain-containing protein n=1 Tax=Medioppia subpectinata TaxID=1979941 RepID=A0A7R9Q5L1_9ACAR|nr:unnamed protein product [Medioppia subpectinata]CAG2113593.1 unnamed protein product [Medioppia subpectinata]
MSQQMKHIKTSLETTDDGKGEDIQQGQMYAKNSMDRFGDDLCQLLMSYLSLEDRFQLECVSKQFQRTVFGSVVQITFNDNLCKRLKIGRIFFEKLSEIAIKCSNIETIKCREIQSPQVLNIFRDNCRHLREISCNLETVNDCWSREFGPLVTRVDYFTNKESLIHCHRLSRLKANHLDDVFDTTSGQLLVKNLKHFKFSFGEPEGRDLLKRFIAANKSINIIEILTYNQQDFGILSGFPELRELSLLSVHYDNSIVDSLRTIGVNCKQLKRLSLRASQLGAFQYHRKG